MSQKSTRTMSSGMRWKIRSARYLAQSAIPRPLRSQAVHLSYYNGRNFGDQLSPRIVEFVLGEPVVESHFAGADLSALGSILDALERWRNPYNPVIWGSGFIRDGGRWQGRDIRPVAVRGALSRERVAHLSNSEIVLGDPGLLVRRMYPQLMMVPKRYRASLIPHISEVWRDDVTQARADVPDLHVIDVRADPRRVLEEIAASEIVLSSSLHGLVCADALDVPNRWVPISGDLGGGDYKFVDYYSAFGRQPEPLGLSEALDAADALAVAWRPCGALDSILDGLITALPAEDLAALYRR